MGFAVRCCRYLIKGREDVIGKLDLGNGGRSHGSHTNTESSNSLL